jgi:hypothetical protein
MRRLPFIQLADEQHKATFADYMFPGVQLIACQQHPLCITMFWLQWLGMLLPDKQQQPWQLDPAQEQLAAAALKGLLVNSPCVSATAAGATAAQMQKLMFAECRVLELSAHLPPEQRRQAQQHLMRLTQLLLRLDPQDVRVRMFTTHVKRLEDAAEQPVASTDAASESAPLQETAEGCVVNAEADAALQQLLKNTAAISTPNESAGALQALPVAVEHVRQLFWMLEPSQSKQQRYEVGVQRLLALVAPEHSVVRYWLDYEVRRPPTMQSLHKSQDKSGRQS